MKRGQPLRAIFALPLAIAALSIVGLVSALTGDGWRDAIAWIGLGAPIIATIAAMRFRRR